MSSELTTHRATLFYVHDPMCSWCYGFKKTWLHVQKHLPTSVNVKHLLGGLAPDSEVPMPAEMQAMLSQTWKLIEQQIPGTRFNFDFWQSASPRRSTWPACRAVIAASEQGAEFEVAMIDAIQTAYYMKAQNPSNLDVLVALAKQIGCDSLQFEETLVNPATQDKLLQQIHTSRAMGVQGFPSLVLETSDGRQAGIPIQYTEPEKMLDRIERSLQAASLSN